MKKKRFTKARIIAGLEDAEVAATAREVCHRRNISEQTFYCWKRECSGMERPGRLSG